VPDFLLPSADRSVRVVNVKPAHALADPEVAAALEWPGRLIEAHGWAYEIWSGEDTKPAPALHHRLNSRPTLALVAEGRGRCRTREIREPRACR